MKNNNSPIHIVLLIKVLKVYRATLSPDHGLLRYLFPRGVCRFSPTCSVYAQESIKRFGFNKGVWLSIARLSRCHPFSSGGFDPVPDKMHHQ